MSKNPAVLLLEHHLKELKLPTFLRDYDSVGAVCSQERCDYPQIMAVLYAGTSPEDALKLKQEKPLAVSEPRFELN